MATQINDGMTLEAEFKGFGVWDTIIFRFRPALPEQVFSYHRGQKDLGEKKAYEATILFLFGNPTKHGLVSWDVQDAKGEMVPVCAEAIRRLPHPALHMMVETVSGYNSEARETDIKN